MNKPSLDRLTDIYFSPVPTSRFRIVRSATFGYAALWLVMRSRYIWDVSGLPSRRFTPIGVLSPLDNPPSRAIVMVMVLIGATACAATAVGRSPRLWAPVAALAVLFVTTLTSSYSQIFHTEHLLAVHLVILAFASLVDPPTRAGEVSGWSLRLMMASVAVVYVVAAVAKMRLGGLDWITGDVLRGHIAADNLRKLLLEDLYSPLGGWLSGVAWIWPPIAVLTILVEFGAPVALFPGRVRYIWVAVAWAFHMGVLLLMAISFPYQLFGVAYLAFLPVEKIAGRAQQRWTEWRFRGESALTTNVP